MAQGQGAGPCGRGARSGEVPLMFDTDTSSNMAKGDTVDAAKRTRAGARGSKRAVQRRIFVLDTNVLMHDPTAIFRFDEHDVFIPMIVLEELDAGKQGLSEAARNVRQVSRFLDELMANATKAQIDKGLELPTAKTGNGGKKPATGRLFFQTKILDGGLPDTLPGHGADNAILGQALALQREFDDAHV